MQPALHTIQINWYKEFTLPMLKAAVAIILQFWQLWLILGVAALVKIGFALYQHQRLAQSGIYDIDKLSGEEFEERLQILFENLGYRVTRTGGRPGGDYGVDLVIERDGKRTAIQAKCYRNKVGEDAIREANTGKNYYHCHEARVVTNSYFTPMAWRLARANYVWLYDRNGLIKLLISEKSIRQMTQKK